MKNKPQRAIVPLPVEAAHACQGSRALRCITCSDEALPARVLRVDGAGLALVALDDATTREIDVTLLEQVAPGDWVLMHGGVALGTLEEAGNA
jgi:hydrogenase maturation factor